MDLPILRYVDVVIGVAVIVLLACTVVTAITQLLLSGTFFRARNLRDALTDLISQVDPKTLKPHAGYIAERLLRHPLVARDNTVFGQLAWRIRAWWRKRQSSMPLPGVNPADTIQREEVIMLLLEWAGKDGALGAQDESLLDEGHMTEASKKRIAVIREALRTGLRNTGIGDPGSVAAAIRKRMLLNECEHPEQPAQLWRSQAISEVATTEFAGKIHTWYDNTMARATENYAFFAQVVASIIALIVAFGVQLDALQLIRRLAQDDKLRATLVAEAQVQIKRQEDAEKSKETAQEKDAKAQREQIAVALADLRDPKRGLTPSYLALENVAQAEICKKYMPEGPRTATLEVVTGTDKRNFTLDLSLTPLLEKLEAATRLSGAPLTIYRSEGCLHFVALNPEADRVAISEIGAKDPISGVSWAGIDWAGIWVRFPGVMLSWILISLGAPFWYDLLKKLISFRSILAEKDDKERQFRNDEQGGLSVKPGPAKAATSTAGTEGDDERGDLQATGAEG